MIVDFARPLQTAPSKSQRHPDRRAGARDRTLARLEGEADVAGALRKTLTAARAASTSFEDAWEDAIASALDLECDRRTRESWRAAFRDTRPAWEASYDGAPASAAHRAISMVVA